MFSLFFLPTLVHLFIMQMKKYGMWIQKIMVKFTTLEKKYIYISYRLTKNIFKLKKKKKRNHTSNSLL